MAGKKYTLGTLLGEVKAAIAVPEASDLLFAEALNRRNYLIHHLFHDHAFEFATSEGRQRLLKKVQEDYAYLYLAWQQAHELLMDIAKEFGITADAIRLEAEAMRERARRENRQA